MFTVFLRVQILSARQIREWDQYTIRHKPVSSFLLMERAASALAEWIQQKEAQPSSFAIFCGKGNNGGDGLALGRMLMQAGHAVSFYILEFGKTGTEDFQHNLQRLHQYTTAGIYFIQDASHFPTISENVTIIDALFGTGLTRPLDGLAAQLVQHLNTSGLPIISIDLPSGLYADESSMGQTVIEARYTLTFQCYKVGLLVQENAKFIGEVQVLDIGLHPQFLDTVTNQYALLDEKMIRSLFKPRNRFGHKGTYGHALLTGGSYGKMGAMVLTLKACLAGGAGLTTAFIPACGYIIMQTAVPEAMTIIDEEEKYLSTLPQDIEKYNAIGMGPGMGTATQTQNLISHFVRQYKKPMVIDADGLNCLAKYQNLLEQLPLNTILTPHPKEFDRIFGKGANDFDRILTATKMATALGVIVILKSHHTLIATPSGQCYFNSTGNAGMAKGGSGDVLTGILTALLAQGYEPVVAAQLGVYLHGRAGDLAAIKFSMEAMLPSHLVDCLQDVFLLLSKK